MSIRVMSRVWEHSRHKGNALLLLLAIADFADDDGTAFPGIRRLAHKARVGETTCHRLLKTLQRSAELVIEEGAGRMTKYGGTNLYHVVIARAEQTTLPGATVGTGAKMAPGAISALRGANHGPDRVPTVAPNPSRTRHIEPSSRARARGATDAKASRTGLRGLGTILNEAQRRATG